MKTWFITGASTGLGRCIAEGALERGDKVCAASIDPENMQDYEGRFGKENGFKTNFFMQTMPYGSDHNVTPSYNDIRMQLYTVMAFGYDGISEFCYQTPPIGKEFNEKQLAMIDRKGQPTPIYDAAKKANHEIKNFDAHM